MELDPTKIKSWLDVLSGLVALIVIILGGLTALGILAMSVRPKLFVEIFVHWGPGIAGTNMHFPHNSGS